MTPLELIRLPPLLERNEGRPEIGIGLIDGPVALDHPDLADAAIHVIAGTTNGGCIRPPGAACRHGTFVAGILCARRGSAAPAICPGCTLLLRPVFADAAPAEGAVPTATPDELAQAILDCVHAGARIVNISAAIPRPTLQRETALEDAIDACARHGVIVIAAAGNQGTLGGSAITRHPWVIPVAGFDRHGRPTRQSNLGNSIGRRGVGAPGHGIDSLAPEGLPATLGGTSAAAAFVTGAVALLWSEFPAASATRVKHAATQAYAPRRTTVVPPLLDSWAAYQAMRM